LHQKIARGQRVTPAFGNIASEGQGEKENSEPPGTGLFAVMAVMIMCFLRDLAGPR
jgi:hypothetical protein